MVTAALRVVVTCGVALLLISPVASAQEGEPETLTVRPGEANEVISDTVFQRGENFRVEVSGTITHRFEGSGDTPGGTCFHDAFYYQCTNGPVDTGQDGLRARAQGNVIATLLTDYTQGTIPGYNAGHRYDLVFTKASGPLGFQGYPFGGPCNGCTGAITVKITPPEGAGCGGARAAAITEVRVVSIKGGVEFRRGRRGTWCDVEKNQVLGIGHEISTDPDGEITLAFADNSTITIRHGTQLKIERLFDDGGVVRVELLLKNGELAAKVNRSETTRSDFLIRTGAGHSGSVRGTAFTVFTDAAAKASLFSVTEGVVAVTAGSRTDVSAGREVEAVGRTISPLAAIGRAGARGGLNRSAASKLVLARVARSRCRTSTARDRALGLKAARGGWSATVKLTGTPKGTSRWKVSGRKVRPANKIARRVAKNCR